MQQIIAIILGIGLALLLWRQWRTAERKLADKPSQLFSEVKNLFSETEIARGEAAGTSIFTGQYKGHVFQLKTITDTLATRKLPSLWLMVTLPRPQNVKATLDLVMRPTALTSFSNFDFLPHTLEGPADFPAHAVIRTDDSQNSPPIEIMRPHLRLFEGRAGKELLISPKGLRIVVQVAEVDRLRYGVFREANFGDVVVDPAMAKECVETLLSLQESLNSNVR